MLKEELKGVYHSGDNIALILPPKGGTMNNRIVYALYKCFAQAGFSVLRVNFRNYSENHRDEEELADAEKALDWLERRNSDAKECWVAGYASGAYTALKLVSRRPDITRFIAVTPPANRRDFSFITPCPVSGLFIQGCEDDIVCPDSVDFLVRRMSQKTVRLHLYEIGGADHYYNGYIKEVEQICKKYIKDISQKRE